MRRGSDSGLWRARFALAATGLLAPALLAGAAHGSDSHDARASATAVAAPRQAALGGDSSARRASGGEGVLEVNRDRLLSGRPGQRLRIRYRSRSRADSRQLVEAVLRRKRRPDPRHPGTRLGGERAGLATAVLSPGERRVRLVIEGLNPLPGPHALKLSVGGETVAKLRVRAKPQSRGLPPPAKAKRVSPRPAPDPQATGAGEVNHDLNAEPASQASSAVAVETDNPSRAIASANDARGAPAAFVSDQGFRPGSVVRRQPPTLADLPGGGQQVLSLCCDPALAADAEGNLWMAVSAGSRIAVNRIAAGKSSFQALTVGLPVPPGPSAAEKPAIAARDGHALAAVWIETSGSAQNVVYSGCDLSGPASACDDADAWTDPVPLTGSSGLYSLPDVAISPNGDVYAVWWDLGPDNAIEIDRCLAAENCANPASWNEDAKVAGLDAFDDDRDGDLDPLPLFCPIIAAPGGMVGPSPSVEVGPAGNVYVAYSDLRENPEPGAESRCTAEGSDKTFDSYVAAGLVPDTIPPAGSGRRLSADGALDVNDHFLPALAVDASSGTVETSFYSTAEDPSGQFGTRVYVASDDDGATYSEPVAISDARSRFAGSFSDGIDYGDRQGAAAAEGTFRPVWTDNRAQQARDPDLYGLSPPVETTVTSAPSGTVPSSVSSFSFSTQAKRLECSLDGGRWGRCFESHSVGPLANGNHRLSVRATDLVGNPVDLSPASVAWTVRDLDPPETAIVSRPPRKTKERRPEFTFTADEPGTIFHCRYDGKPFQRCEGTKRARVKVGKHLFEVRATDVAGNVDATPAAAKFERKRACPKRKRKKGKC